MAIARVCKVVSAFDRSDLGERIGDCRDQGRSASAARAVSIFEIFAEARATAFAFCTSVGRFIGAGVNFGLAGAVAAMGTLGTPIALTAIAFGVGLLVIPFARETPGQTLPD